MKKIKMNIDKFNEVDNILEIYIDCTNRGVLNTISCLDFYLRTVEISDILEYCKESNYITIDYNTKMHTKIGLLDSIYKELLLY